MTIEIADKTDLEVSAELLANIPDTYQKNAGYFLWDLMLAIGKVFVLLWQKLQYLCAFFNLENLEYDDLVKFVLQRKGIVAKTATYATGEIKITSSGTVNITEGDLFETVDGLQFEATQTVSLTTGQKFSAQCLTSGIAGNVPVNSITVIPVTITNLTAVTNDTAFTGGYEKESKEDLLERYLEALREPISSGNIYHYKKWAKECTGVGDAKIKPLWNGDNTVKVIICDSNKEVASSTLVATVQQYIDPNSAGTGEGEAPIGAYCTVASATQLDIDVSATVTLRTGVTLSEATTQIRDNIKAYLKTTVFSASYVSYARIGNAILDAEGVSDYSNLLLNGDTDNVTISDTTTSCELAMLDDLTITQST